MEVSLNHPYFFTSSLPHVWIISRYLFASEWCPSFIVVKVNKVNMINTRGLTYCRINFILMAIGSRDSSPKFQQSPYLENILGVTSD